MHALRGAAGYHLGMNVPATTRARRALPESVADALLAVGLTVMGIFTGFARPPFDIHGGGFGGGPSGEFRTAAGSAVLRPHGWPATTWVTYSLVAAAFLPLALRRRFPVSVLAIATAVANRA